MGCEMECHDRRCSEEAEFRAKKSLGQHFLVDENVLEQVLSAAALDKEDVVVEVGPGLGVLTRKLASVAGSVVAVELDHRLVGILKRKLASCSNVKVIQGDILNLSPASLIGDLCGEDNPMSKYKVVANLPYYITSPILRHFLQAAAKPSLMVIMVQKEVGEAIAARPGKMRLLAVSVQLFSRPTIVASVPACSFRPVPKVESLILRLDVYQKPLVKTADIAGFLDIVSCGFHAPHKQLQNSLAHALALPSAQVATLLSQMEIDAKRRAETLTIEEWGFIYEKFVCFREQMSC